MSTCLVIVTTEDGLYAALLRRGLRSCETLYTHQVSSPCQDHEQIRLAMEDVLAGLAAAKLTLPAGIRLCLDAETVLFRDWSFPFTARSKIRQTLSLLLDTEFAVAAPLLAHRFFYAKRARQCKGQLVLSASFYRKQLDLWREALAALQLFPTIMTVDPFAVLPGIPEQQGTCLVLHVQKRHTTVCILKNGIPQRIRLVPQGWSAHQEDGSSSQGAATARLLANHVSLVLEGMGLVCDRLLLFGDCFLRTPCADCFAQAFSMPVSVLGQDIALAGQYARDNEKACAHLQALCLAQQRVFPGLPHALPSFHRPGAAMPQDVRRYKALGLAGCGLFLMGCIWLASIWAEGHALNQQALQYEMQTKEIFRQALPDIRGSFNTMQMQSILQEKFANLQGNTDKEPAFFILRLLQHIHTAVPSSVAVRIDSFAIDAKRCMLHGAAPDYGHVNTLRQLLAEIPGIQEASIVRATAQTKGADTGQGEVLFEINLRLAEKIP